MTKYNVFRYASYVVEILILYALEMTLYNVINIAVVKPIFTISAGVSIAMLEDRNVGMFFGVFIGFLMDISMSGIFGFNAILFAVLSFIVGNLTTELIKTNILTALMTNIAYIVIVFGLQFLVFYLLKGYSNPLYALKNHYLSLILFSVLPSPLIYLLNRLIFTTMQPRE